MFLLYEKVRSLKINLMLIELDKDHPEIGQYVSARFVAYD
jgi:hypothetical protein